MDAGEPATAAAPAAALPSAAELKAMIGPAGEVEGLNVVCRVDEYETLLQAKLQKVQQLFAAAEVAIPEAEVHTSPPAFFRYRADFRVWHLNSARAEGKMFYAMTPKGERQPVEVQLFPMGSRRINELMPQLLAHVQPNQKLRKQLYEARFLTTLAGDSLITLIYHKPVNDEWKVEAAKVASALGVSIVGRSRKRKMVVGEECVTEELTVLGEKYRYKQKEGAFSQPNAVVCQKMLTFAVECTSGEESKNVDLLELYCGNGNFTAPMSRNFRKVVGTEIAKESVKLANDNMAQNGCDNVQVERLSSEDFSLAFQGAAPLKLSNGGTLSDYNLHTLLVDPPRAGMDERTCNVATTFNRVVYISCNPETMVRDIKLMAKMLSDNGNGGTLKIDRFAVFDQFPYTDHLECGALISIGNPTPRVPQVAPAVQADEKADSSESAAQASAMAELAEFIKDDTRTLLAFAPELLTSDERNTVRRKAVLQPGYKAKSKGGGANRQLVIVKPGHSEEITAAARSAAQSKRPGEGGGGGTGGASSNDPGADSSGAKKQKV